MFPDGLRDRFNALWNRCRLSTVDDRGDFIFDRLQAFYSESGRYYHNTQHIAQCLETFDEIRHLLKEPDAVEMSLWFHDAVYDTQARDNEARSVDLFRELTADRLPIAFINRVSEMIMYTVHREVPENSDAGFVVDIDLSSLGKEWRVCKQDSDNVRAEKGHLSDEQFIRCQRAFFVSLINRPHIFCTPYFRQHYEQQARENIQRQIALFDQ